MIFKLEHDVDLALYLPPFKTEYKEIKKLTECENPEFKLFWQILKRTIANQFIMTADSEGLARYEKMLGIVPNKNDTLEIRRNRILVKWNNQLPYTLRQLKNMLDVLCGKGNYSVELENNIYNISINTYFYDHNLLDQLNDLIIKVLPANLAYKSTNFIKEKSEHNIYVAGVIQSSMEYILS